MLRKRKWYFILARVIHLTSKTVSRGIFIHR